MKFYIRHRFEINETHIAGRFGSTAYGTKLNDLLEIDHFMLDFDSKSGKQVLLLREDYSEYYRLFLFTNTNAESVTQAIFKWCAALRTIFDLLSNENTHSYNIA